MLSPFDDYPIHPSADPIAHPATGDPNHYDRYWFNGHQKDGRFYFGAAMGHYPVRFAPRPSRSRNRGSARCRPKASSRWTTPA
jgi:hypothetical protein